MSPKDRYADLDDDLAEMLNQEEYDDCFQELINNMHEMKTKEIEDLTDHFDSALPE